MIISQTRQIILTMIPRVASTATVNTLVTLASSEIDFNYGVHNHMTLAELTTEYNNVDFSTYRKVAFYRDPLERCLSMLKHIKRGRRCADFFHAAFGNQYDISCAQRKTYDELSPELQAVNDSVTMYETFHHLKWFMEVGAYGRNQRAWLDYPNMELFDYAQYALRMRPLLNHMGLNGNAITIPRINASTTKPGIDDLSPAEEAEIKTYLADDYAFFASKGIVVPSA